MSLPADDYILLSYINTKLRDEYSSLEDLCASENFDKRQICMRLNGISYEYDPQDNAFKRV